MNSGKYVPRQPPEGINSSQENPLKGFVILLSVIVVAFVVIFWSLEKIGEYVVERMEHQTLNKVFASTGLLEKAYGEKSEPDQELQLKAQILLGKNQLNYPITAYKISDSTENAFVLPTGDVFFTSELIKNAETDEEIDFILCHEVGHYHHKHGAKRLGRTVIVSIVMGALSLDANILLNSFASLREKHFSRKEESEADEFALDCLYNMNGKVDGYSSFFERNQKNSGEFIGKLNKLLKYQSTHPLDQERIDHLSRRAKEKGYL